MSAPTAISGPIERAGGVSAGRLQLCFSEGLAPSEGPQGAPRRRARWVLVILCTNAACGGCSRAVRASLRQLCGLDKFGFLAFSKTLANFVGSLQRHSLALAGRRRDQLLTVSTPTDPYGPKSR